MLQSKHQHVSHDPDLASLLQHYRGAAEQLVRYEAGVVLLRFEGVEDLVQGAYHNALRSADAFEWHGEAQFIAWLKTVIRRHMGDRRDYWFALKRNRGRLLRLTWGGDGSSAGSPDVAASGTGPGTFAERREQLLLLTKATDALLPRDRDLVMWSAEGLTVRELAERLNMSADAVSKARSRAFERLRKIFRLMQQGATTPTRHTPAK